MSEINTGAIAQALRPGVNAWFGLSYKQLPEEWREIFDVYMSNMNYEKDVGVSGFGLATVKPEGTSFAYDTAQQAFEKIYTHVTYALGFIITREAIEDNLYPKLARQRAEALARSMRKTQEIVAANVLNRATDTNYVGADLLPLASTAHLLMRGGTYSNRFTTGADLSEASLESALTQIRGFVDDANIRIAARGMKLIIHPNDEFEACRILQSEMQNDTANNALNAMKRMGKLPQGYVVNDFLTDPNAWFIKTDTPEGFKMWQRRALEINPDTDFDTENVKFKATMRFSVGWTDPRCVFVSPGA